MASIMDRLKKNSKIKDTSSLDQSPIFQNVDFVPTTVPMINVALSGRLDGGLTSGLTVLAGPSKHFKSMFGLLMASAYLNQYPDAIMLFYDSEFGSPDTYFDSMGIDTSRVLHTPITNIESFKFDIVSQLEQIEEGDRVIIVVDSIGNLASKKEVEDAINEKSVADMSRAKALKGLFRMVTPYLTTKSIPMVAINHTYQTIETYSKQVVSGGKGIYYSANNVWIIGRQQDKDSDGVKGYSFIINVDKSRFVKERSKIPVSVSWEGGIDKYSGLLDIALISNHVTKPSQGWYARIDPQTGEEIPPKVRAKDTANADFWEPILSDPTFQEFVKSHYSVGHRSLIDDADLPDNLRPDHDQ